MAAGFDGGDEVHCGRRFSVGFFEEVDDGICHGGLNGGVIFEGIGAGGVVCGP